MRKLSMWISKFNSIRLIMILSIISLITYICMGTNLFGILYGFETSSMLDVSFFYTANEFTSRLESLTQDQVSAYLYLHLIDYLFIFSFYPALTLVYKKSLKNQSRMFLISIVAMFSDFFENLIIDIKLIASVPSFLGSVSGVLTTLKFTCIVLTIIMIIIIVIRNRRNHEKANL